VIGYRFLVSWRGEERESGMPHVVIKTGFTSPDGTEETLTAYLCDVEGCPETAVEVLGAVRELGTSLAVCKSHGLALKKKPNPPLA
jgi:hypothetical protein